MAVEMKLAYGQQQFSNHLGLTYWMSHRCKYPVRSVDKRGWGCSDGNVDPFILLGIWNNKINSIVGIPCIIVEIENSRVGKVKPQWVLSKRPPLKSIALFWSVFVCLETYVKMTFLIYFMLDALLCPVIKFTHCLAQRV
jgi:hypothetical protein